MNRGMSDPEPKPETISKVETGQPTSEIRKASTEVEKIGDRACQPSFSWHIQKPSQPFQNEKHKIINVPFFTDFRLESRKLTGFALALDDQVLHVSIFALADGRDRHAADSRIERFSRRRQNRRM